VNQLQPPRILHPVVPEQVGRLVMNAIRITCERRRPDVHECQLLWSGTVSLQHRPQPAMPCHKQDSTPTRYSAGLAMRFGGRRRARPKVSLSHASGQGILKRPQDSHSGGSGLVLTTCPQSAIGLRLCSSG